MHNFFSVTVLNAKWWGGHLVPMVRYLGEMGLSKIIKLHYVFNIYDT